jgi:wobble nucleotide-excising tRNase
VSASVSDVTGIHVDSDFLGQGDYEIFINQSNNSKSCRFALIYGENGSGKTTIARSFSSIGNNPKVYLLSNGKRISIDNNEDICVFSEDYVDKMIKLKENGLDTIILLDNQVDLSNQIENCNAEISATKEKIDKLDSEISKYQNVNDANSPEFWKKKIEVKLKEDDGWAYRDGRIIKGNSINTAVTDVVIRRLATLKSNISAKDANDEYLEKYKLYLNAEKGQKIEVAIPEFKINLNFETIKELLNNSPAKPQLSQREKALLDALGIRVIKNAQDYLKTVKDGAYCEYCLQQITGEYKKDRLQKIDEILNDEVGKYTAKIENSKLENFQLEIPDNVQQLYPDLVIEIERNKKKVALAIEDFDKILQHKLDNIFDSIDFESYVSQWNCLLNSVKDLNESLKKLKSQVVDYNSIVDSRTEILEEMRKLSDIIAHYQIISDWTQYNIQIKALRKLEAQKSEENTKITTLSNNLNDLVAQRKSIKIAADAINRDLAYIYGNKDRFGIELSKDDQLYHLLSYGKEVEPKKISVGERNILAMCYYFTRIGQNNMADSMYKTPKLLIIDDPVSSFDSNVRVGLMSYFRKKLGKILKEKCESKVVILTHDVYTAVEFEKIADIVMRKCKSEPNNFSKVIWKLENKQLIKKNLKDYYEYGALLNYAVKFAKGDNDDSEYIIGNVLRRILEAFSTFAFKSGIEKVQLDSVIMRAEDKSLVAYFDDLMYKLFLNGESHLENAIKGNPDGFYFSAMSLEEKKRFARDILSLIYIILPSHLLSYMPENKQDFENWVADIKKIPIQCEQID